MLLDRQVAGYFIDQSFVFSGHVSIPIVTRIYPFDSFHIHSQYILDANQKHVFSVRIIGYVSTIIMHVMK